jgi:hypothetical protein
MACSLSSAPCQHSLLAGREHGRTIPLADIDRLDLYREIAYARAETPGA